MVFESIECILRLGSFLSRYRFVAGNCARFVQGFEFLFTFEPVITAICSESSFSVMSMSGWSLDEMDDIDWNEFQQSNDLIVPDPSDVEERQWVESGKQLNKLHSQNSSVLAKIAGRRIIGCNNAISGSKVVDPSSSNNKAVPAQSLNVDMWDVLEDEELERTEYNPMCVDAAMGIDSQKEGVNNDYCKNVKLESDNRGLILGYCKEDPLLANRDAALVTNSCHFLLNDISSPEGELDFFGGEHKNETSNGTLDYCWENISNFEEVDKLFRYSESNLAQAIDSSSDELTWHASLSSSNSHSKSIEPGLASSSPEAMTSNPTSEQCELKMKNVPCNKSRFHVLNPKCDSKVDNSEFNDHTSGQNEHLKESLSVHILASQGHIQNETETLWEEQVDSSLLQTGISDEFKEKVQMKSSDKNASLNSHESQVPYIHASYGHPSPHMPMRPPLLSPGPQLQQSCPGFSTYQLPADMPNQRWPMKRPSDMLCSSPIMMPQDKIKKTRWCNQMQDMMAVDHNEQNTSTDSSLLQKHRQNMHYQHAEVKPQEGTDRLPLSSNGGSDQQDNLSRGHELTVDDKDDPMEAAILHQLQASVAQLYIPTRLCIRDALYRLATSAMQRHDVSDSKNSNATRGEHIRMGDPEASSSDYQLQDDRCAGFTNFETETNAIDRSVAHLLFHRSAMPSTGGSLNATEFPSDLTTMKPLISEEAPNSCLWQPSALHGSTWLGANTLTTVQTPICGQVLAPMPDSCIGSFNQGITNMKSGSSLAGTCSTSSAVSHSHPRGCGNLTSSDLHDTGINPLSRHQGAQNNSYGSSDLNYNVLSHTNAVMENSEGFLSQYMKKNEILEPNTGNQARQESLQNMDVEICDTNFDILMSEETSEVGVNKELHVNYTEAENTDHVTHPISPPARIMLVH